MERIVTPHGWRRGHPDRHGVARISCDFLPVLVATPKETGIYRLKYFKG